MKKYKLQDLVANGSHSRIKVDSDLLVGDIRNGYGYGDVLDANATKAVATGIAENKVNAAKQELIQMILELSENEQDYSAILQLIEDLLTKNLAQDMKDAELVLQLVNVTNQINNVLPTVGGDNDTLIFNID